jgi:hypothetical protein
MAVYEKEIIFDSHESYQSGTNRNIPIFNFNESIYANSFYISRVSFKNYLTNVLAPITLEVTLIDKTETLVSNITETFIFTPEYNTIDLKILSDKINELLFFAYADGEQTLDSSRFTTKADFRREVGILGLIPYNLNDSDEDQNFDIKVTLIVSSEENLYALNEFRDMLGRPAKNTLEEIWFTTSGGGIPNSVRDKTYEAYYNTSKDPYDDYATRLDERPFDDAIPKYLFLHSNLSEHIKTANHLKIGERLTVKQNDVVAVIPVTEKYGERVIYEKQQDYTKETAIQIGNECNINNVGFYFTRRVANYFESGESKNVVEIPIDFRGRTFQVTVKYFTTQLQ